MQPSSEDASSGPRLPYEKDRGVVRRDERQRPLDGQQGRRRESVALRAFAERVHRGLNQHGLCHAQQGRSA